MPVPRVFDIGSLTDEQCEEHAAHIGISRRLVRLPKAVDPLAHNFCFPEHDLKEHHITVEFGAKMYANIKLAMQQGGATRAVFPTTGRMRVHKDDAVKAQMLLSRVATDNDTSISIWDEGRISVTVKQAYELPDDADTQHDGQLVVCVPLEHRSLGAEYVEALGLTQKGDARQLGTSGWVALPTTHVAPTYEPSRVTVNIAPLAVMTWSAALERANEKNTFRRDDDRAFVPPTTMTAPAEEVKDETAGSADTEQSATVDEATQIAADAGVGDGLF
eukprot:PhM_4_TR3003/c2_g2_i2/m.37749